LLELRHHIDTLMDAVIDDDVPTDHYMANVARSGGEDNGPQRIGPTIRSGEARTVETDGHEVGEGTHRQPSATGPAETLVARTGRRREKLMGAMVPAPQRGQPFVQLDGPRLLERIDHGM
jgi:hypothetical protein